jgi:circadian clock protein KaiB
VKSRNPDRKVRGERKSVPVDPGRKFVLWLFLAGASARSRRALLRVRRLCEAELKENFELEVIDVYQHPEMARECQIVAIPTLVKVFPLPARRYIGNFANVDRLLVEFAI